MKTILLHVQDHDAFDATLQTALALARAFSAHLTCIHITPAEALVAFDSLGGVFVMQDVMEAIDKGDHALREKVEHRLAAEDVSWNYEQVTGSHASVLAARASLADLLVADRQFRWGRDAVEPGLSLIGELLHKSRTPLYLVRPEQRDFDPSAPVAIAWNGSVEAANAVRTALPFLKRASLVRVISVPEDRTSLASADLLRFLAAHDIEAQMVEAEAETGLVAGTLVGEANQVSAGLLVMGGYGHRRLGEQIFGGVTRDLLRHSPLPLLLAR